MNTEELKKRFSEGRQMERIDVDERPSRPPVDEASFDLVDLLKGTWVSDNRGWNLIALPFRDPAAPFNYRVLMNQYGETLKLKFADRNVPNRGVDEDRGGMTDQLIDALDYEQIIHQVDSADSPESELRALDGRGIHHEPGLFLHLLNHHSEHDGKPLKLARLATIPHGDSVLALGKVAVFDGAPSIPASNALPLRVNRDLSTNPYLGPYKTFEDAPFFGKVPPGTPNFPGFFPTNANAILQSAHPALRVKRTTELHFDTAFGTGGIVNIPFIVDQANASDMTATFWIMELEPESPTAPTEFVMQYSQTVMLDFFDSPTEPGELIQWPHVSINTLRRV